MPCHRYVHIGGLRLARIRLGDPPAWSHSTFHGDSLTVAFAHPSTWRSQLGPLSLHYGDTFAFVANFSLLPFCGSSAPGSFGCLWAKLGPYPPNAVLMTFGTTGYGPGQLTQTQLLGHGTPVLVGGHQARRTMGIGQGCLGTGATNSESYSVLDGRSQGAFWITFCFRGPNEHLLMSDADQVVGGLSLVPGPSGVGAQPE